MKDSFGIDVLHQHDQHCSAQASVQSSLYHQEGVASHAVDGNRDGNYGNWSCTHTNAETNPWWRVDLGASHRVAQVFIVARSDCCGDKQELRNIVIHVGDSLANNGNTNARCGGAYTIPQGKNLTITCSPALQGRYVSIMLPGAKQILTLCEVEVYPCNQ
ncbi:fucolectin [Nematostella vectensis]|uniref:fucolectin n=1 Tax=Nematostella vectensis TaxID=45351 RepID=UPI002077324B|nr:fucolectin [Nematostella vectensis]